MPTEIELRRKVWQTQRQFMAAIKLHGDIETNAREYMDALARFRIELFSMALLGHRINRSMAHVPINSHDHRAA